MSLRPFLRFRVSPAVGGIISTTYLRPASGRDSAFPSTSPPEAGKLGAAVSPADKSLKVRRPPASHTAGKHASHSEKASKPLVARVLARLYLFHCGGQPQKGLFVVALAFTACSVALYLRLWGRSTISVEFVMRLLKRVPHGPI